MSRKVGIGRASLVGLRMGTAATTAMVGHPFYHKARTKSSGKSQRGPTCGSLPSRPQLARPNWSVRLAASQRTRSCKPPPSRLVRLVAQGSFPRFLWHKAGIKTPRIFVLVLVPSRRRSLMVSHPYAPCGAWPTRPRSKTVLRQNLLDRTAFADHKRSVESISNLGIW